MRTILCYGDSNTWGYNAETQQRFDYHLRWTTLLSELLGNEFRLIDEGLCGRTTVFTDPLNYGLNGFDMLEPIINTHMPIDLLIFMLGTNDCKQRYNAPAENISRGMMRLVEKALALKVPKILIITPIYIDSKIYDTETGKYMGEKCSEKSFELATYYKNISISMNIDYLNANDIIKPNIIDFMHLDQTSLQPFAQLLYKKIQTILS